jgi:hypothetical protein
VLATTDRVRRSPKGAPNLPLYITLTTYVAGGATGKVFRDKRLGLAVKVAHNDEEPILNMRHEASVYNQLNSLPHLPVPRFYGHFHDEKDDHHMLLMEWCGISLAKDGSFDDLSEDQK